MALESVCTPETAGQEDDIGEHVFDSLADIEEHEDARRQYTAYLYAKGWVDGIKARRRLFPRSYGIFYL
jgi:hypothetical protein